MGRHLIRRSDGRSSHNLFGIKAGGSWSGERVRVESLEHVSGEIIRVRSEFRAYPSLSDGFADYVALVSEQPRYARALANAADPSSYIRGLQDAGYATDPDYADKVLEVLGRPVFNGWPPRAGSADFPPAKDG